MNRQTSRLIALALFAIVVAAGTLASLVRAGQERGNSSAKKDEVELNKYELANKVTITAVATDLETVKQQYSASDPDDKQIILVSMTNTSGQPIGVAITDSYIHYRPRLLKDGKMVPYKESRNKIIEAKEKGGLGVVSVRSTTLQPNQTIKADFINLADWYGRLEPGRYELSIKYRFRLGGKPIDTNTVTFEIVP